MRKILVLVLITFCLQSRSFSQQLPLNTCGIVYIYDAAGNRTKRTYFCNNGGTYPTQIKAANALSMEYQPVDALFPNPTTDKCFITFSKPLQNASVRILDEQGRVVYTKKASGNTIMLDLSNVAAGVYYVQIQEGQNVIVKKVVKHHPDVN